MNISIFGLGYVGAVSLGCLARDGHQIVGVDIDQTKLDLIQSGKSPIIEEGIQELIEQVVAAGRITTTTDAAAAVSTTEVSFVCVGTPSSRNGSQDLTAIRRLSEQLGEALKQKHDYHLIVIRSTIFPGTLEEVIQPIIEKHAGKKAGEGYDICFQPEFLREGSSIRDYDNPPMTVVGTGSERATEKMRDIFAHLPCAFITTDIRTAEMLKYACNIFHALKITFANEIGRLSQSQQVDPHSVMSLLCQDTQLNISKAYLLPGFAYGGSCLPKDLKAMLYVARQKDVSIPMLSGIHESNQKHIDHASEWVLGSGKKNVAMIGLSFKTGTDDLRESPLVVLAERFIGKGLNLKIYDPEVHLSRLVGANRRYIEESIPHIGSVMGDNLKEIVADSDIVILGLNDFEIISQLESLLTAHQTVLDLVRIPDPARFKSAYHGVCW